MHNEVLHPDTTFNITEIKDWKTVLKVPRQGIRDFISGRKRDPLMAIKERPLAKLFNNLQHRDYSLVYFQMFLIGLLLSLLCYLYT